MPHQCPVFSHSKGEHTLPQMESFSIQCSTSLDSVLIAITRLATQTIW